MILTGILAFLFLSFSVRFLRERRSGRGGAVVVARVAEVGGVLCMLLSRLNLAKGLQLAFVKTGLILLLASIVAVFAEAAIRWRKRPRRVVP